MELNKTTWSICDIAEFQKYLLSFSKGEYKGKWEQKIINTSMPCIAVPSPIVKQIVKEIYKGNYLSFINLWIWDNWTNTSIIGNLISKIKDFNMQKQYLLKYIDKIDNWASCDVLKFKVTTKNANDLFEFATSLLKSPKTFVRRTGIRIFFSYINDTYYLSRIFDMINKLNQEKEYYVNMAVAWLVAECFTKQREQTLKFLQTHNLNNFTINKAIQKCRDSYRISNSDKEMLLKFKVK